MIRELLVFVFILSVAPAAAFAGNGVAASFDPQTAACAEGDHQVGEAAPAEDRLIVRNLQGVELGEIINFVVDTEIGKVAYALLDTGGAMEAKDLRLVPLSAFQVEDQEIFLNMDEKQLADAPVPAQGLDSEEFHRDLSEYFGVAPYWEE